MRLVLFAQGFLGEVFVEHLESFRFTPIVYTYSYDHSRPESVKQFLRGGGNIRYIRERRYNPEFIELRSSDLVVCADWTKDFFHNVSGLKTPIYHIHPSLLPLYRGYGAVSMQFLRGVAIGGVTFYRDNGVIDGGDILYQQEIPILLNDTPADYLTRCGAISAEWVNKLMLGENAAARVQDESLATHTGRIRRKDGFIDLNMGALYVHNTVRAYSYPYFGAYFYHNGQKITVWKSICEKWSGNYGRAGEVIAQTPDGVEIACGEGSVVFTHVSAAGADYEYDGVKSVIAGY